jgi:tRNA (guanine26-N2/guanine27-N2)-dimethyltransferase
MGVGLEELGFPVEEVVEGSVRILVPRMKDYLRPDGVYEPSWAPVFYNPRMAFNRDVAVVFARVYRRVRGLDRLVVVEPLAGSGVRAVRYAVEAGAYVVSSDIDLDAVRLAGLNAERNRVADRVRVEHADANELMGRLRREGVKVHVVDIDPFGSPVPYIDTAIQLLGVRGVLAVTATDTAPLSGTHPRALRRKYDVLPARPAWEKEQAVRILAGYIIRRAAAYEMGARILLAYYADYYVRVYAEVWRGARRADESLSSLSYGLYCPSCGYTGYTSEPIQRCPYCSGRLLVSGPLYSGPLCDPEIVRAMLEEAEKIKDRLQHGDRVVKLLTQLSEECSITKPYYRLDRLCSILHMNMPKVALIVDKLKAAGFKASRTHFDPRAFKTDAPHATVINMLVELRESRG